MIRRFLIGVVIAIIGITALGYFKVREYLSLGELHLKPGEIKKTPLSSEDTTSNDYVNYTTEVVTTGLEIPWSIVFTSPERMVVTERGGAIRAVINNQLQPDPLIVFDQVTSRSEEGLMGLTLDPEYDINKRLYTAYAYTSNNGLVVKVVELLDNGDSLEEGRVIIDNLPAAQNHAGTRIKFGPDGKLYITTGDASQRQLAQDMNSLAGKILRLNSDGTIPEDNPFKDSPIFSLGHRNPQGIDWHPELNYLVATEHGPSGFDGPGGGDEVNLIEAGKNYGWPVVSHDRSQAGMVDPLITFTPAEAPASGMFYSGSIFPQFKNHYFFGALKGEGVVRLKLTTDGKQVSSYEKMDLGDYGRIRDITEGPDGYIYFSTSNRDGRGQLNPNDDKIIRLVPQE